MAVAAARRSAAASDLAVAQQFPNPILSLTPELVTNAATGTSPWTAAVLLTWLIRSPGSRAAAIDQAVAAGQGAAWDALAATWEIRSQVRTALLDLVLARSAAALAGEELALRRSALAIAETRVRVGAWGQPELDRARAEQLAAETQHASAAAGADAALLRVATATGLASQAALPAALALPDLDGLPQVLAAQRVPDRDAVVLNRLDVARALAEYDRADAAWRAQVARRFPDLSAGPGYTYDRRDHKIVVAVSGEVPLLHSNDAAQAAAEARRTEAAAAVEVAQAAALAQFSRAGATLTAAAHGLAGAERVVAARRSATAAERRRVAAGAGERNDVVARELECVAARRLEMDALRTGVDALTQLEASVQRPLWPQSLLDVRADARADGAAVSGVDDTLAGSKGVVQDLLVSERLRGAPSASAKESLP
ncbi:MAG: TolC family protein [Deltaproteobacteria bacterium]|nr:TolC family protein [Deltaproteobacteria bacterium]